MAKLKPASKKKATLVKLISPLNSFVKRAKDILAKVKRFNDGKSIKVTVEYEITPYLENELPESIDELGDAAYEDDYLSGVKVRIVSLIPEKSAALSKATIARMRLELQKTHDDRDYCQEALNILFPDKKKLYDEATSEASDLLDDMDEADMHIPRYTYRDQLTAALDKEV